MKPHAPSLVAPVDPQRPLAMPVDEARRRFSLLGLAAASSAAWPTAPVRAQEPANVSRMLCGYPAGGSVDLVARKIAEWLIGPGGQPPVTENKTGAAGRIAVEELKRSPADASSLLVTPASVMTMYPHVYRQLSYDPFKDATPVAIVAMTDFVLAVGPTVPADVATLDAFRRWCADQAGPVACGNAGAGSMPHFMAMIYARETGARITHVPYRGGGGAMQGTAAGEVPCAIATEAAARAHVDSGRLRVIATTAPERSVVFAQAPSFAAGGLPALDQREWFGVFAAGGSPQSRTRAISERLRIALRSPDVQRTWEKIGLTVLHADPDGLRGAMRRENDFWGPLVRDSGFVPEN